MDNVNLADCFDAQVWAEEFCKRFNNMDKDVMIGWFANAIMAGYDNNARKQNEQIKQLNCAMEAVRDNTLNPARTMTKLGLEEAVDACHRIACANFDPCT